LGGFKNFLVAIKGKAWYANNQSRHVKAGMADCALMSQTDIQLLIDILPPAIQTCLKTHDLTEWIELVMDLGRVPEARFSGESGKQTVDLGKTTVFQEDLDYVVSRLSYFSNDNRAGIPRTLHRISCLRNRQGDIIGLTCRVGKVVTGTIECIQDLVTSGKSLLLLGRPGVGKTTKLREIARLLAETRRVVIVDTANEIAGDGDIPHPAVGRARRLQVPSPELQKAVMIEAVQNHTPEVIVVDEIGTEDEAMAARTIAERGVVLIATAHGSRLENIVKNPMLCDLVGGVQTVTLGDDEAKRRLSQKTILEREKKPTFDVVIEIRDRYSMAIYPDVAQAVDSLLDGKTQLFPEVRRLDPETGEFRTVQTDMSHVPVLDKVAEQFEAEPHDRDSAPIPVDSKEFRLFLYGIGKGMVDRILERLNLHHVRVTKNIHDANAVVALKLNARPGSKVMQLAKDYEVPTFLAKANTMPLIQRAIREALEANGDESASQVEASGLPLRAVSSAPAVKAITPSANGDTPFTPFEDEKELALKEALDAIEQVKKTDRAVELAPRRAFLRRLQHQLIEENQLLSFSVGDEPNRRLRIAPPVDEPA
jgi:stage III sporulation protein SpoIIIAA